MDIEPEVRTVADRRLTRVEPHADAQLDALRPGMSCERALRFGDCLGCPARVLEDDEELVAAMVDNLSGVALNGRSKEPPVISEDERIAVAEGSDELRRALDIGEDECDGSMGEIRCQSLLQWDLGPNAGSRAGRAVDR
jgi:hypothetical protein